MSLSYVDPIEQNILDLQRKLFPEIKVGIDKINSIHGSVLEFKIKKNGCIEQIPDLVVEADGLSVDVTIELKTKINKFNFLQEVKSVRKNRGFLTKEILNNLLNKYPDAKAGIFNKVRGIIKSIAKEYKQHDQNHKMTEIQNN